MTFRPFSLYVDVLADSSVYEEITNLLQDYRQTCSPVLRTLKSWDAPLCTYDLLVIDVSLHPLEASHLALYKTYYETILVVNVPEMPEQGAFLLHHQITYWLKTNYTRYDLQAVLKNYLKSQQLQFENSILDKLIESAQNSVVITDLNGNIEYANPYFEEVSGYTRNEFLNKSPNVIKSNHHDETFYKTLWEKITSKQVWEGIFVNKNKYGSLFYEEATITPILNAHGELSRYLKIGKNITRERLLLEELSSEVKLARKVVDTLLPKPHKDGTIQLDYTLQHHNGIGGDFVFFNKVNDYKYNFAIIDVMGHGVSAALIAITLTQIFADYIPYNSLETSVNAVNRFLCAFNEGQEDKNYYATGTFASFDFKAQTGKLINAGHNDSLAITLAGNMEKFPSSNLLLGVISGFVYEIDTFSLKKYSHLFFFTDGLYEKQNIEYQEAVKIIGDLLINSAPEKCVANILEHFEPEGDDTTVANIILSGNL